MSEKYLKAVDVKLGEKKYSDTQMIQIICKDDDGNKYIVPFTFKEHYAESVSKTFGRLSPIHLSKSNVEGDSINE